MGRKRWTPERQRTFKEADWIVGWLRNNGPSTTREITTAMGHQGIELRAHVISKALRKSPFIIQCGSKVIDGMVLSVWMFDSNKEE